MNTVDVFISANSSDFSFAWIVHDFLTEHGLSVFFCEKSLPLVGESDYRKQIFKAIDKAQHMVVVTSSKSNAESDWVQDEWGTFLNEKRSKRKTGNLVTVVTGELRPENLPIELRQQQVISLNDEGLNKLISYVHVKKISEISSETGNINLFEENEKKLNRIPVPPKKTGDLNTPAKSQRIKIISGIFGVLFFMFLGGYLLNTKIGTKPKAEGIIAGVTPIPTAGSSTTIPTDDKSDAVTQNTDLQTVETLEVERHTEEAATRAKQELQEEKQKHKTDTTKTVKRDVQTETSQAKKGVVRTPTSENAQQAEYGNNIQIEHSNQHLAQEDIAISTRQLPVFYVPSPSNNDKNIIKVVDQLRQEIKINNGRVAVTQADAKYAVIWGGNAKVGKEGPDNLGEFSFSVRLQGDIVDVSTGQKIKTIAEEEIAKGRDNESARILDTLTRTVAKRLSQQFDFLLNK